MHETDNWRAVHTIGHRAFVGGNDEFWDSIGNLQFDFPKAQGLKPGSVFLDIGCGALRGGICFIEYLEPDHYLAIDKHIELIIYGVASEIGVEKFHEKRPRFVVSDSFEFLKLGAAPEFALAQSLFTHLTIDDILLCLRNLRKVARPGCKFFATFFETKTEIPNADDSHSHGIFHYTRTQMENAGRGEGWQSSYVGDWNHPRGQHMIEFTL